MKDGNRNICSFQLPKATAAEGRSSLNERYQ